MTSSQVARADAAYWLSANVIKASEDKTFPGAVVASLASPWGQAVSAGTVMSGVAPYFGSYREVFSRDLYEAFTGFLADGDLPTARAATRFLFDQQQLPDGRMPRNSLVNGLKAPDTGGDQLDETAYPILMAWQSGLDHDNALWTDHIKKAADFLVAHGPSSGRSGGRSRAATRPRRSRPRSPASWPRDASPTSTGTTPRPMSTGRPPTTSSAASRAGP